MRRHQNSQLYIDGSSSRPFLFFFGRRTLRGDGRAPQVALIPFRDARRQWRKAEAMKRKDAKKRVKRYLRDARRVSTREFVEWHTSFAPSSSLRVARLDVFFVFICRWPFACQTRPINSLKGHASRRPEWDQRRSLCCPLNKKEEIAAAFPFCALWVVRIATRERAQHSMQCPAVPIASFRALRRHPRTNSALASHHYLTYAKNCASSNANGLAVISL